MKIRFRRDLTYPVPGIRYPVGNWSPVTGYRLPSVIAAVALAAATAGCSILGVGVRREYHSPIDPNAAPVTYDAAAALSGRSLDTVAVLAETTTANVPLDSQTVRRVAEKVMPAVVSVYIETAEPYRVSLFPIPFRYLLQHPAGRRSSRLGFLHSPVRISLVEQSRH
jgi:hypothetical protein